MRLPTAVIGFVRGNLRWEANGGAELFAEKYSNNILLLVHPKFMVADPKQYAITHLQKKSKLGFLLMSHAKWWQLCFHVWYCIRPQQTKIGDGGAVIKIPGSEIIFYFRFGFSRWDAGDSKYVMGWIRQILGKKIVIPFGTWYGPGLHLD